MKNTTAIAISFLRPAYTIACIKSLREMYPEINIVVGENGDYHQGLARVCGMVGAKYIQLPYDSGVCVARNTLIKEVETEFVLVGDDDFFYTESAKVDLMVKFLENRPEFDLVGGRVIQNGQVKNYQGNIEKRADHFQTYPINPLGVNEVDEVSGLRYCKADLTFNYFVGRTEAIRRVPWDEQIKVAYEHFTWFYDFKLGGGRVAFSPDPIVVHKPEHVSPEVYGSEDHHTYMAFRNRKSDKLRFFKKYKINFTIGMNGVKNLGPEHIVEKTKSITKYIDFCITTFKRPKALERLLFSIVKYYPSANIYIADQNDVFDREFYRKLKSDLYDVGYQKRISVEHLDYDVGLSFARNHLVATTPNKYKLILDDDFEFTKETEIQKMVNLLENNPKVGVVGGLVKQLGQELHFEFNLEVENEELSQESDRNVWRIMDGIKYKRTGCVLNFALFRKDVFNHIRWDQDLKVSEHMDFYIRMRDTPWHILYTPDVIVDHGPVEKTDDYKDMRQRTEFQVKMMRKHRIKKIRYMNGQVVELLSDGSLKKYKEKHVSK
jgi:glycosyltransferase involved in cell wall biosynthesis